MAAPMGHGHGGGMHGLEKPKDFKGTLGKLIKYINRYHTAIIIVMIFTDRKSVV